MTNTHHQDIAPLDEVFKSRALKAIRQKLDHINRKLTDFARDLPEIVNRASTDESFPQSLNIFQEKIDSETLRGLPGYHDLHRACMEHRIPLRTFSSFIGGAHTHMHLEFKIPFEAYLADSYMQENGIPLGKVFKQPDPADQDASASPGP